MEMLQAQRGRSLHSVGGHDALLAMQGAEAPAIQPTSAFPLRHPASGSSAEGRLQGLSCVVVQCPGQLGLVGEWEQGEGSSHTSSRSHYPCSKHRAPWFPQAEHITSRFSSLMGPAWLQCHSLHSHSLSCDLEHGSFPPQGLCSSLPLLTLQS